MNYKVNGLKILIKSEVLQDIKKYYYTNTRYETGGILFGRFNWENKIIEVSEVYEIKPSFFQKHCIREIRRKHKNLSIKNGKKQRV